ncbi:putative ribonuclease H-like domain-containing protein [Tanacetum coccineum]
MSGSFPFCSIRANKMSRRKNLDVNEEFDREVLPDSSPFMFSKSNDNFYAVDGEENEIEKQYLDKGDNNELQNMGCGFEFEEDGLEVVWKIQTFQIKSTRGQIDKTLFIKRHKDDILLVQVYVDDIIFGSTKKELSTEFEKLMHDKFQISSIGELAFFLGLQVQQKSDGIFISQDKYVADILKKFDFSTIKIASTPMEPNKALIKDEEAEDVDVHLYRSMIGSLMYLTASSPDITFAVCACARDSPFDLEAFSDSDYAGASLDRKSTIGAEYVSAANCYGHVLWIQNQMLDYGFNFMKTKIYIDNESTICIIKNPIFHSKTRHIEIRHHFIRDSYEKKLIQIDDSKGLEMLLDKFEVKTDETIHKEREDRKERAVTTASSLEAEQDSDAQTRFETASIKSNDPPLSRVNTLGSGEDNMKLMELMEFCNYRCLNVNADQLKLNAAKLKLNLMLLVLVNAAEGDFINTSIKGFNHSFDRFYTLIYSLIINPNSILSTIIKIITLSNPKFAETHNLVAFLDKPEEGAGFEEIVDFLNASHIKYALTVNPTVYESCIQQFWATAKVKTVNGERQIQALVDKKKVIITETSTRRDLKLDDAEGTDCLSNDVIFEQLSKMGICDLPQSDEDRMKLDIKIDESFTNYSHKVSCSALPRQNLNHLPLEIESLKRRVKSLEKKRKSRTPRFKRLKKVGSASRVESSNDVSLGTQEVASKQGRKIVDPDDNSEGKDVAGKKNSLYLAQNLIEIKAAKPKAVTSAAATTTRPKARRVIVQELSEFKTTSSLQASQLQQAKDKGKGIMVEPKVPLKKKIKLLLKSLLDNWMLKYKQKTPNKREREELTDEEKAKLFMELIEKRRKHFAALRAQEKRNRPPTKAQKRIQMSTYLKHMEVEKGSKKAKVDTMQERSSKRAGDEDDDIAIDAIPLATKPPLIVEYKIVKEGIKGYYQLIRAD